MQSFEIRSLFQFRISEEHLRRTIWSGKKKNTEYRVLRMHIITLLIGIYEELHCMYVCMHGHTYSKGMDQPGKVANPARGQLNRDNEYFPVPVRA